MIIFILHHNNNEITCLLPKRAAIATNIVPLCSYELVSRLLSARSSELSWPSTLTAQIAQKPLFISLDLCSEAALPISSKDYFSLPVQGRIHLKVPNSECNPEV